MCKKYHYWLQHHNQKSYMYSCIYCKLSSFYSYLYWPDPRRVHSAWKRRFSVSTYHSRHFLNFWKFRFFHFSQIFPSKFSNKFLIHFQSWSLTICLKILEILWHFLFVIFLDLNLFLMSWFEIFPLSDLLVTRFRVIRVPGPKISRPIWEAIR